MQDISTLKQELKDEVLEKIQDNIPIIQQNCDILKELFKTIPTNVNFTLAVHPDSIKVEKRIAELKKKSNTHDKVSELDSLQKRLLKFKVNKRQFQIKIVEIIQETAEKNNWDLCKKNELIYIYNGGYWSVIADDIFKKFLIECSLRMGVDQYMVKHFTFHDEIFKQFTAAAQLPSPDENKEKVLLNLTNGTFEINPYNGQKRLKSFDKNDFIKHQLPYSYDPYAKCPEFLRVLNEIIPVKEKQLVLAEFIAYAFVKTSILKLEKALLLYGSGANGKSLIYEIVLALLSEENVSGNSLSKITTEDSYRANLENKILNFCSEISGKMDTSIAKQVISGEPVEVRRLYKDPHTMTNYAKLIFNTNELPHDVEHSNAFFRRFIILHFDVTIPPEKQDKRLAKRIIENELPGIFNWVLEGLERLLKQKGFSYCEEIENTLSEFKKESDSVKLFLEEEEYQISIDNYILRKDFYRMYGEFCRESGYKPVKALTFKKRLEHHGIRVDKIDKGLVVYVERENNTEF